MTCCRAGESAGEAKEDRVMVGIGLRRAGYRWRVTKPALSIASWDVGVESTSCDLAVRVLRNPVARGPCHTVALGPGRRSANALWTDAECPSDRGQRWNDASCRVALHTASREPVVAGCDIAHAVAISSRPGAPRTV
jgi:hypothetical protein